MSEYTLLDIKRPQKKEPDFGNMTLLGINMPSEPVEEEKSGVITELGRGLIEGVAGMGETAGTLMKIVSGDKGKAGPWLEEKSRTFADKFRMPEDLQGSVVDSPGLLLEPRWWAHGIGQVAGSMAAPIGVGGTAAKGANALFKKILTNPQSIARATKYTGIGAAGATGGAMEGTQTYNSVLEETGDKNKALKAGSLMALGSAALNSLSFGKMLSQKTKSKVAHIIASGVTEGATEQAEEPWEAIVSGHPEKAVDAWIDGFNVFFPSLIVGGLGGAGGAQLSKDAPAKNTLSNDEIVEIRNAIRETAQEEDLSPEEREYVDWWLSEIEKAETEKGPMEQWPSVTPRWVTEAEAEAEHLEAQRDFGQGKLRDRLAMEEEMYGRDYPALPKPDVMYQEGEAEPQGLIGQRKVPMIESKTLALPKPEAIHLPDQSVLHLPNMSVSEIVSKKEQILKHSDMTPDDLNQLIIDKQSRKFETGEIEKPETAMRSEATRLGLEYVGIQEGVRGSLHLFTDPQNGSTFAVPEGESVDAALKGNRERFATKTPVGETGDTTVQPKAEEATGGDAVQGDGAQEKKKTPYFTLKKAQDVARLNFKNLSDDQLQKAYVKLRDYERYTNDTHAYKDYLLEGGYFVDASSQASSGMVPKDMWLPQNLRTALNEASAERSRRMREQDNPKPSPQESKKEPWEMGRDEWLNNTRFYRSGKVKNAQVPGGERVILSREATEKNFREQSAKFLDSVRLRAIRQALSENKPVPPEVLKDYPELTQKPHDNIPDVSVQKKVTKPSATESATPHGWVEIKGKQRPFTTYREILRGKNKGMYRVSVGGKGYLVDKGKIARFPEEALDKEISKANIAVDEQRAVTRKSLKKDHPDWSAQRVEDELAKTVRAGEEAGVSEANERAGKPVKKRLFEKKAVGAETAPSTAKHEPVSQKPKPVTESRQKKTPDLTATFPSSYSKTPREVLGKNSLWKVVSKDGKVVETEYATHPHILIVMDKKDRDAIGYQGKTPQGSDAVVSKEVVDSQLKSFKKRGTEVKTIEIAKYAERDDWGILSDGNIEVAVNPNLIGMVKRQHPNATFYLNGPERPIAAFDGKEWKALIMPWRGTDFESVRKDAETIIEVPASAKVGKASSPPRPQGATVPKKQNVITGTIREKVDEAIKKAPEIDSDDLLRLDEIRDFKPSKWESDDAGKKRGAEDREFYDSLKKKYGTIEITSPTGQGWKYNIINTKHHLGNFKKQIEKLEKGKEGIALFRKKAKAEKAVTEISVDSETLTNGILSRMNRTLKSMGYDVRGADDIKMLLDRRMLRNGKLWHEDWIRAYQQAIEGAELAKARKAQKSERKHIDRSRLRELGYTNDPREAGYITPIGKLIDLSGKREGGQPGTRSYDHREAGGTLGMQEFMDEGSIRMDYRAGSFDIVAMPTSAQLKIVRKIAAEKNGEITLDLWEGLGEQRESYYLEPSRVLSVQYREGTKPSKIINDIKTFYAGEMPSKTLFRKSDPTNTGIPIPTIKTALEPITAKWKGAPKIVVTNTKDTKIPKGLMRQMGDAQGVAGAFYEDTVYLFNDNIDSIEDAQKTILHESAHWGPRRMFGRSFDRFLRGVLRSADKGVLDRIAKLYDCDMTKVPDRMLAAEEYVAHISETVKDPKTWNRFTSYVKQWLIKRGFTVKLSDDEIRAIVSRGRTSGAGTAFTKKSLFDKKDSATKDAVTSKKGPGEKPTEATPKPDGGIIESYREAEYSDGVEVPDGWYIHGIGDSKLFKTIPEKLDNHVVQMTKGWDWADWSDGGGTYAVKPKESAKILDFTSQDTADIERVIEVARKQLGGDSPQIEFLKDLDELNPEEALRESLSPGDLGNSAGAFDNLDVVQWLFDNFDFDMIKTPDGAVLFQHPERFDIIHLNKSYKPNPNQSRPSEKGGSAKFRKKEDLSWADSFIKENIKLKGKPSPQAEAPVSSAVKNDTLTAVEGSRLDEAATKYLAEGSTIDDYLKHIPQSIGKITINDVFKYDPIEKQYISTIEDKNGKLKPAIRQSGFYALKEFSDSFKGKKDISKREGMWSDVTRLIQAIDGGKFGGMAQKFILWPSRSTILAKVKWSDTKKARVADLQEKYHLTSGKKAIAFGDVSEFIPNADIATDEVLNNKEVQKILKSFNEQEKRQIIEAAKEGRAIYDELIAEQNKARKQIGRDTIGYLENYKPHVRDANIWSATFGSKAKIKDIMESPELPDFIRPNQPFNPRAMARENGLEGYAQERNGIRLLADYIETAAKDIFHTNVIHNNKIHAAALRSQGIENGASAVDAWTAEVFAGVNPRITKAAKEVLHPKVRGGMLKIRRNLTRAVFPLNWTWNMFVQTSSAGITFARYGAKANIAGLKYFTDPVLRKLIREQAYSMQIKSRWSGSLAYQDVGGGIGTMKRLEASRIDKIEDFMNYFTQHLEQGLTGHATAAAYYHGKKLGLKGRALLEYASEGGGKTQSMYNLQDIPGLLRAREVGAVAPFQTFAFEMFNTVREMNLPVLNRLVGKTGAYETISANSAEGKALMSNRLKMTARFMAAMAVTNAVAQYAIDRDLWSASAFIPFWGLITGDTWGMPTPIKYMKDFLKGVENIITHGNYRRFRQWFLRYHALAGIQIERTVSGIEAVEKGGVYDVAGRRQYPVKGTSEQIKAITMGPSKTEAGRKHFEGYNRTFVDKILREMKNDQGGRSRRSPRRRSRESR